MSELELFVRIKEAAKAMAISEWTLRNHLAQGEVPHIRFGRAILIPKAWLARKLQESLKSSENLRASRHAA